MRYIILAASLAGALSASSAFAQDFVVPGAVVPSKPLGLAPSKQLDVSNVVPPGQLESGATKITESEARTRIQAVGFSNVTDLVRDETGIWRAKAKFGDRIASVGLDHKGNVAAQ